MGVDLERLLDARAGDGRRVPRSPTGIPGSSSGSRSARAGARAATRSASTRRPTGFGLWAEQLLAESTGKEGKGLVPAPGEAPDGPDRQRGELALADPYDLGAEFYRWEFATAVAGTCSGSTRSTSPNVQAAKDRTNEVLAAGRARRRAARARSTSCSTARRRRRLRRHPGVHRPRARAASSSRCSPARARPAASSRRPRPALPALDGPAAQGRARHGLFVQVVDDAGAELPIPGRDFGFATADPRAGRRRLRGARGARPARRPRQTGGSCMKLGHGRPRPHGRRT